MNKIFILGPGRSGTTLMRNLLDWNSQLAVYPVEVTNFLERYLSVSNYVSRAKLENLNFFLKSDLGVDYFGRYRPSGIGIPLSDLTKVDKKTFWQIMCEDQQREIDVNEYFERIFTAFRRSISRKLSCTGYVMDTTSPNIGAYLNYFSDVKIIFMIRNPLSCYNSYKRNYYQNVDFILQSHFPDYMPKKFFDIIYNSFLNLSQFKHDGRVLIVRLEDLQTDSREVMALVANFLKISYSESLLQPTELGSPCKSNTLSSIPKGEKLEKIHKLSFSDIYLTEQEKYLISKVIPCGGYYKLEYGKIDGKKIGFGKFLNLHGKWWQTRAKFPKNVIRLLYGLLLYIIAYRSYSSYIENYFNKFNIPFFYNHKKSLNKRL